MRYMPAEWEEHRATWLAWPHNKEHWPGMDLERIWLTYVRIIQLLISSGEKVGVLADDALMQEQARSFLWKRDVPIDSEIIQFVHIPTNSSWVRDWGPIFVRTIHGIWATDWRFNGWGGEYPPWEKDDAAPTKIAEDLKIPCLDISDICLEGGAIEVNGEGTLLTVEGCLNHKKRNPRLEKENLEYLFRDELGVTNVIWLPRKIASDHTGHVDNIARFVYTNVILCALEDDRRDENYEALRENFLALERARDAKGERLVVLPLPMPEPVYYEKERLPASYANFYIANRAVLVPTFNCSRDEKALKLIDEFFPRRRVVGIDCRDLLWGMGTIHCSAMQQPVA